jgi:hypothetical protein
MADMKEPVFIFTQELIRIFEQILFADELPIVCENVFQASPGFRKWVEERGRNE